MSIRRDIRFRVYIAFTCICLFGVAIMIKAAMIQVKEGKKLRAMAKEMNTRFDTLIADRGNIYNEDGVLLSSSVPEFDVHLDFEAMAKDTSVFTKKNLDSLCKCLATLFKDKTAERYKEEYIQYIDEGNRYYLLGRKYKYYEYEVLRTFPIFNRGRGYGFIVDSKEKRVTPNGKLAYRTIGVFRDSNVTGLEAMYNDQLAGENGRRVVQKIPGNNWVPIEGSEVDPQNGKDIVTTLDMNVQNVAETALEKVLDSFKCQYGTCIVMETATGKIRALANLGYQKDGSYWEDYNYATIPTEPGSTFKLATLISLLNDRYINVDQIVNTGDGKATFGGQRMEDTHGVGTVPIWSAFAHSSNVAMAKLATQYYGGGNEKKFIDHLFQLKLDQKTGIDLKGEGKTVITTTKSPKWSNSSLPWMATGYGVQITPLHTCMLYNAVANGGKMMKPYLVSEIRQYGKPVMTYEPKVVTTIGDSFTVSQLLKCTRAVMSPGGTGKDFVSPFYAAAGKTGTAQVADKGISYADGVYQGSFVGFIPADKPKYTICVVVRTKKGSTAYYGAIIAAPVFKMVADKIFSLNMGAWEGPLDSFARVGKGVMPAKAATVKNYRTLLNNIGKPVPVPGDYPNAMMQLTTDTINRSIAVAPKTIYKSIMPDVKGMSLKDAVYMLEYNGLHVKIQGKGKVQMQSIAPGTMVTKGQNVILQLS